MMLDTEVKYAFKTLFKYPYQRVRYGYDERIKWGFSSYFENMLKPLEELCRDELKDTEHMDLNPDRKKIYTETLRLIKRAEAEEWKQYTKLKNGYSMDWKGEARAKEKRNIYIAKHIEYYWD